MAFYAFRLVLAGGGGAFYVPCADGRSTAGEVVASGADGEWGDDGWEYAARRLTERPMEGFGLEAPTPGFQITVYEPAFATPDWLAGAVMYQIFPDRFARGAAGVRSEGLTHYGALLRKALDDAGYERIDPLLGDEEDFRALVAAAEAQGISIVLDAVLSHTGDDSRFFNANGAYDVVGAAQGPASPFYDWYDFSEQPDGKPYRGWWGHMSLPEVDEHDPAWQRYALGWDGGAGLADGSAGVLQKWLSAGARGRV